jgi:hypothetical protein
MAGLHSHGYSAVRPVAACYESANSKRKPKIALRCIRAPQRQKNHFALCFGFGRSALNIKYVLDIRPNGVRNLCRIIRYELGDTFWTRDPDDC